MLRFVLLFYVFVYPIFNFANAPKPKYKPQFIIKLQKTANAKQLHEITDYKFLDFLSLNIENTLYSVTFNENKMSENEVLSVLQQQPFFETVQKNHVINLRGTTPNDTFFNKQWHLNLIEAVSAWDIHRSATNRRGDTIVIAVIDDGLHVNHPDFKGNIWINYADTANNGIDDDSNGYVDDHYGWNFMGRDNDISDSTNYKAVHGTQVAGIIGAKTNNKIGVSGIMWNVKLMIVNIADTGYYKINIMESDALRAYNYVLHQRKLYNQTNGEKGAFVVATNSSWGVDSKFAQDAPLWCSMYDSLGKYGVLNASAATNANRNIDVTGDLPSLCTSKHLIVVGSSTRYDAFSFCGRSDSSVDLSAPGGNVFTTNNYVKNNIITNSLYTDGHSGTSFSTPMVTAAIGILHGYACERILDSFKRNPEKGNLLLRKFILESVDEIPALYGMTATGGRLNIKKALLKMDEFCYNLSINDNNIKNIGISIFPNPGNGNIKIETQHTILKAECFDITGKKIQCSLIENTLNFNAAQGLYLINITTDKGYKTFKYINN